MTYLEAALLKYTYLETAILKYAGQLRANECGGTDPEFNDGVARWLEVLVERSQSIPAQTPDNDQ